MKSAKLLWVATAVLESGAGVGLLCLPATAIKLLLGVEHIAPETDLISRVAGAALLCIGIACWAARNERRSPGQRGLLAAILIYNLSAAGLLGWAGADLQMVGIALWPGVVLHTAMFMCCSMIWVLDSGRAS